MPTSNTCSGLNVGYSTSGSAPLLCLGKQWKWFKCFSPCHLHGRPGWKCRLLASVRSCNGCHCNYLASNPAGGRFSLSPSVCVSFSSPSLLYPSPSFLPPLFPFPQISLSSNYINLKEHTLSDMQEIDECKDH